MARPYPIVITPQEARRGVYLDFEGHLEGPPVLAGRLIGESDFAWTVFDETFFGAARDGTERAATGNLGDYLEDLVSLCEKQDRRLICFTEHELDVIRTVGGALFQRACSLYRNTNLLAKQWFTTCQPETYTRLKREAAKREFRRTGVGLKDYLDVAWVSCPFPAQYRNHEPATALGIVRSQLEERACQWSRLAKKRKFLWTRTLRYNRADWEGLRCLTTFLSSKVAAEEIDA
jgi:hypothetical protein